MTRFLSEDGLRYFYNQIKSKFAAASHNHSAGNITSGTLPIVRGGTGADNVAEAVKTLLGSASIGSSTKPLYYDGEALKACADSIGGGGIVDALLEENGYAKFANGLILQWGFHNGFSNSGQKVKLNIAHTNTNYIILSSGTIRSTGQYLAKLTTQFTCAGSTWSNSAVSDFYWATIGI